MRIAYLDCFSGISGDMCLGALVDAGASLDAIRAALATLPMGGYRIEARRVVRAGIAATQVEVKLDGSAPQPHRGLGDVVRIIRSGALEPEVADRAVAAFSRLAEAEARVHQVSPDQVHFHEVGAVDAICDVVGTAVAIKELGLEKIFHSRVMLGGGAVRASHGMLPVPAPATAELLKGVPAAGGPVDVELTTPTGAAILRAFAEPCSHWPAMSILAIGYGAGARDLDQMPNVLRLAIGEVPAPEGADSDCIWVLETNIDDMTGQELGYCVQKLMEAGALDAYTRPVQMKKNRPGAELTVLCEPQRLRQMEEALWKHTSTLGIRRSLWQRSKLPRELKTVQTPWGPVRVKVARLGDCVVRQEPEYEDCRAIAEAHGLALREVYRAVQRAAAEPQQTTGP